MEREREKKRGGEKNGLKCMKARRNEEEYLYNLGNQLLLALEQIMMLLRPAESNLIS